MNAIMQREMINDSPFLVGNPSPQYAFSSTNVLEALTT